MKNHTYMKKDIIEISIQHALDQGMSIIVLKLKLSHAVYIIKLI